ncbi:Glutamine--fructose-6-phosphate aminotransferase (isomerizing) [Desulfovibrionales bacterium]
MCGIIAYAGHRPAVSLIMEGLKRLEYRGYDSAGVAFVQNKILEVVRAEGKLVNLEKKLEAVRTSIAMTGIGHTRWATHGLPVERNAHPHQDNAGRFALVHNGIIENYQTLLEELQAKGHVFHSETDTEVLVHLVADEFKAMVTIGTGVNAKGRLMEAIGRALTRVEGSFAIAMVSTEEPNTVYGVRHSSPLVLGVGTGEFFLASDIPAFLPYARDVVFLEDGELVRIDAKGWQVLDLVTLKSIKKTPQRIDWDVQAAQKGGYKHFMLKEIFEQPRVISDCLAGRVDQRRLEVELSELAGFPLPRVLHIIACGTSFHAGLWGKYLFEAWVRLPVQVEIASEFRYRDAIVDLKDVVLVVSQSGETADSLACLRQAKKLGVPVLGLCNVVGSSIAREVDVVIYNQAGPEISVASTKAMCSQLILLVIMALVWGARRGTLPDKVRNKAVQTLKDLPSLLEAELPRMRERAITLVRNYADARSFLYLGRGPYYPLALEGALKLKEISYIHAEGYAAGEMKHGPIALIDPHFPTFVMAFNDLLFTKVKSNIEEVQARGGKVIGLTHPGLYLNVDDLWVIPDLWGPFSSFLALPALQLFAYEMADYLGKDVDQPRNLAKSVTVE